MEKKKLVYIVDDEIEWLKVLSTRLSLQFEVKSFGNPDLMLNQLDTSLLPSVFLFDIYMPSMTGLELTDRLGKMGVSRPVLIMSGSADRKDAFLALHLGVFDIIEKPTPVENVVRLVNRAVNYFEFVSTGNKMLIELEDMTFKMSKANQYLEDQFLILQQQCLLKGIKTVENTKLFREFLTISEQLAESKKKLVTLKDYSKKLSDELSHEKSGQAVKEAFVNDKKKAS
jgi:FixJ family two-component response regulator